MDSWDEMREMGTEFTRSEEEVGEGKGERKMSSVVWEGNKSDVHEVGRER